MSNTNKLLLAGLITVVLFLGITALKESKQSSNVKSVDNVKQPRAQNNLESQENDEGNVIVTVKPKILKVGGKPVFELEFETHSVELDFDVAKQSSLIDDKGNEIANTDWDGSLPGGHHRNGILTFDTILTQTTYVELDVKNIAGIPNRKFKWNL